MNNNTMPKKPDSLIYDEAEYKLFSTTSEILSETGLPAFQLEIIVNKLSQEVARLAKNERETAITNYKAALERHYAEEEKKKTEAEVKPVEEPKTEPEATEEAPVTEEVSNKE